MSDLISSDNLLNQNQESILSVLVSMIIPASQKYNIPGADDAMIMKEIINSAAQDNAIADAILLIANTLAVDNYNQDGQTFGELTAEEQAEHVRTLRIKLADEFNILVTVTAQCYYRDTRVMKSLDMPPRAPFPEGYAIDQGDWSLLEPVKNRSEIYRKIQPTGPAGR